MKHQQSIGNGIQKKLARKSETDRTAQIHTLKQPSTAVPLTPIKSPSQIQMLSHKYFANYGGRQWAVMVCSKWPSKEANKKAAEGEGETKRRQSIDRPREKVCQLIHFMSRNVLRLSQH